MSFIISQIKFLKTMKKLELVEMEKVEGGFCGSREYREALSDAFDLGNEAARIGDFEAFKAYHSLFWSLVDACR
jgi:hypothetical protein